MANKKRTVKFRNGFPPFHWSNSKVQKIMRQPPFEMKVSEESVTKYLGDYFLTYDDNDEIVLEKDLKENGSSKAKKSADKDKRQRIVPREVGELLISYYAACMSAELRSKTTDGDPTAAERRAAAAAAG